ncbi:MAG: lysophospholipid acyltransferase family protein [Candidatus Adiutrix sp.]|jgi:KDO2-lipid IV(A) lauroyltransferase|nr:lysophospholipid acyltransferase family protein [Candidatus Adiutrix sp.]
MALFRSKIKDLPPGVPDGSGKDDPAGPSPAGPGEAGAPSPGLRLAAGLFRLTTWPLAWLPTSLGLALGAAAGRLAFRLSPRRRRIALANIEMVRAAGHLPAGLDAEATARESFANLGRGAWEALKFFHRGLGPFWTHCRVEEGLESLREAQALAEARGSGLLIVTGHIGNWELMCQYAAARFFGRGRVHIVGRSLGSPLADALVARLRTSGGQGFIFKTGGAKAMLEVLRGGGSLGTLIDQAAIVNQEGLPLPFLGLPALTNVGPLRLARRNNSPVIMMLFRREGREHIMKVLPLLDKSADPDKKEALIADAVFLNEALSDFIRQYPDQWLWGHRRWKTPEGVAGNPASIT